MINYRMYHRRQPALCLAAVLVMTPVFAQTATPEAGAPASLQDRLARVERLLQSEGLLDMLRQLEQLQNEVNRLRGQVELQNHTLQQLQQRQRDLYADLDQRLLRLNTPATAVAVDTAPETGADVESPPLQTLSPISEGAPGNRTVEPGLTVQLVEKAPTVAAAPEPAVTTESAATTSDIGVAPAAAASDPARARADYQQAFKLLKQSLYEQAIKAFREFLAAHGDSDFADNAQYWLAETYYVTRQFEQAKSEYETLVNNYPDSQKLTHALLKIGFCEQELGNLDAARSRLEKLRQQYPDTTAARLAEERLRRMAESPAAG